MPPKPKFTREQIIAVGLDLVRERGLEGLTAREVGARLGAWRGRFSPYLKTWRS